MKCRQYFEVYLSRNERTVIKQSSVFAYWIIICATHSGSYESYSEVNKLYNVLENAV